MIYINAVRKLIDPIDKKINRLIFDIKFIKNSTGKIITGKCVCTSTNWENDTINLKFISSGEIRTVHAKSIIEFNGEEVMV